MTIIQIPVKKIQSNPWQTRDADADAEYIQALATSIERDGLLQVPSGRWIWPEGKPVTGMGSADLTGSGLLVQLAFGHSRLSAFRFLVDAGNPGFDHMPVNVVDMTDEEMFRHGVEENLQRKNLSPIEEARAMLRYREDFGKTSVEIGALFGLSESAVRNKMRLVGLPAEIQAALSEGRISEGAGRELLRLFDLPEEAQEAARKYRGDQEWKSTPIVDRALSGMPADKVREMINRVIQSSGHNLHEARWKWDEVFDLALNPELRSETCKGCEVKLVLEGKTYCPASNCYQAKFDLWTKRRLAAASLACGIRAPDNYHDCGSISVPAAVRSSGCANLRVMYDSNMVTRQEKDALVPGFDDVKIVCGNRNSICTCANGLIARQVAEEKRRRFEEAKIAVAQIENRQPEAVQQPKEDEPVTSDELRAAAREERQAQKREIEDLNKLRMEFALRVREAALNWNRYAWYALLNKSVYNVCHHADQIGTIEESLLDAALKIAEGETAYYNQVNLDRQHKELDNLLIKLGLSPLPPGGMMLGYRESDGTETVDREVRLHVNDSMPGQLDGETPMEYFERTDRDDL